MGGQLCSTLRSKLRVLGDAPSVSISDSKPHQMSCQGTQKTAGRLSFQTGLCKSENFICRSIGAMLCNTNDGQMVPSVRPVDGKRRAKSAYDGTSRDAWSNVVDADWYCRASRGVWARVISSGMTSRREQTGVYFGCGRSSHAWQQMRFPDAFLGGCLKSLSPPSCPLT